MKRSVSHSSCRRCNIAAWVRAQRPPQAIDKLVLGSIAEAADWQTLEAFPSVTAVAADTMLERKRVMGSIDRLIAVRLLEDTGKRVGKTGQVRVLRLLTGGAGNSPAEGPLNGPVGGLLSNAEESGSGTVKQSGYYHRSSEVKQSGSGTRNLITIHDGEARPTGPSRSDSGRDGIVEGDGCLEARPSRPARGTRSGTSGPLVERARASTPRGSADASPAEGAEAGGPGSEATTSGAGAPLSSGEAAALAENLAAALVAEGAGEEAARQCVADMRRRHGDAALVSARHLVADTGGGANSANAGSSEPRSLAHRRNAIVTWDPMATLGGEGNRVVPLPIVPKPRPPEDRFSDGFEWDNG